MWSSGGGCSRRSWWVSWRGLCWCTCLLSLLLLSGPGSYAATQNDLLENLTRRLQTISAYTQSLETELTTWKTLSAESEKSARLLSQELEVLRAELETLQSASADSLAQVVRLTEQWRASELKLRRVLESSQNSEDSWRLALDAAELEARKVRLRGIFWTVGGVLVGGLAGFLLAK